MLLHIFFLCLYLTVSNALSIPRLHDLGRFLTRSTTSPTVVEIVRADQVDQTYYLEVTSNKTAHWLTLTPYKAQSTKFTLLPGDDILSYKEGQSTMIATTFAKNDNGGPATILFVKQDNLKASGAYAVSITGSSSTVGGNTMVVTTVPPGVDAMPVICPAEDPTVVQWTQDYESSPDDCAELYIYWGQ